jgi:hypothetical protein
MVFSLTATFSWFLPNLWPHHLMWVSHITLCLIHVRHVTCVLPFIILLCIMLTYAMETCQMAVCLSDDSSLHLSWLVSMWWCAFPLHVSLTHGSTWQCPCLGCRLRTTFHPLIRMQDILHPNMCGHTPLTAMEIRQNIGIQISRQSAMDRPSATCHCNHIIFTE